MEKLIDHIERIFPNVSIEYKGELFNDEKDYAPPRQMNWYEIIERLNQNGIEIKYKDK